MKKDEFTGVAFPENDGMNTIICPGKQNNLSGHVLPAEGGDSMTPRYAGHGRLILIGVSQDIEEQLSTGRLMNPEEYLVWIEYLREVAGQMETEYRRITEDTPCIQANTVNLPEVPA